MLGVSTKSIAVADNSGYFENQLTDKSSIKYHFVSTNAKALKEEVNKGMFDAALLIPSLHLIRKSTLNFTVKTSGFNNQSRNLKKR